MKTLVIAATAAVVLTGIGLGSAAQAAVGHRHGGLSPYERAAIARSQVNLNAVKWRARADGRVTPWERVKISAAQSRHDALVYRYRHN